MGPIEPNNQQQELEQINSISKDIETETRKLNETFEHLEDILRSELNISVTAWCPDILESMRTRKHGYKFGYCRIEKYWKLACRRVELFKEDDENGHYGLITPINSMPRKVRIEAAELIPVLIKELKDKSQSLKNTISNAANILEDIEKQLSER